MKGEIKSGNQRKKNERSAGFYDIKNSGVRAIPIKQFCSCRLSCRG
jgi:hypothetical protein